MSALDDVIGTEAKYEVCCEDCHFQKREFGYCLESCGANKAVESARAELAALRSRVAALEGEKAALAEVRDAQYGIMRQLDAQRTEAHERIAALEGVEKAARALWISLRCAHVHFLEGGARIYDEAHKKLTAALFPIAPGATPEVL